MKYNFIIIGIKKFLPKKIFRVDKEFYFKLIIRLIVFKKEVRTMNINCKILFLWLLSIKNFFKGNIEKINV